jgi:hypothetical protein
LVISRKSLLTHSSTKYRSQLPQRCYYTKIKARQKKS